tara:strand:+ start:158 stop:742 length:585 start_codon:yes stop_codon:yes gene_type:complete
MSANIQDFNIQDIEVLTQSFANLLPKGKAFEAKNILESNMRLLLNGLSQETKRATASIYSLASQFIPNLTDSYIEVWEKFLGIPDDCIPINVTDDQRRLHIIIKLAYLNLYSKNDYYKLAELLGVEIVSYDNSTFGSLTITILNKPDTNFPLLFDPLIEVTYGAFIFGSSNQSIFECLVEKYKPAHVAVIFVNS